VPAHLPRIAQLLGFFPRSYEDADPSATGSRAAAATSAAGSTAVAAAGGPAAAAGSSGLSDTQRRAALAALLQRRAVTGPEGTAFMPCMVAPLGAGAAADSTAAARVLHVLQGGLETGLWSQLPEGHTQRATGAVGLSADAASVKSLTVSAAWKGSPI
jgi:hypothetical protein